MKLVKSLVPLAFLLLLSACQEPPLKEYANKPPAPALELVDMDGNTRSLAALAGKPVIVNFWATWCPPCREEIPSMNRAWQQLSRDGVEMLAISVGESEETVSAFLMEVPVEFPVLLDESNLTASSWPVRGLPTTYIVDPAGRVVYQAVGPREWDDPQLMQQIRELR